MATRAKIEFIDPVFNEYIHNWILGLTTEQMKFLSATDLKKIKKGNELRRWIKNASLDEKLILLAKTGLSMYLIFSPKDSWAKISDMKGFLKKYFAEGAPSPGSEVTQTLIKDQVFVLGSPQLLLASYYLHQNCQSDYYRINRTWQKLYQLWEMAGKNLGNHRTVTEVNETAKGVDTVIDITYKVLKHQNFWANLSLASPLDIQILLYLMRKTRHSNSRVVFNDQQIMFQEITDGTYTEQSFGRRLFWLVEHGFIIKNSMVKTKPSFAIHDRGVATVMEYVKLITNQINIDL